MKYTLRSLLIICFAAFAITGAAQEGQNAAKPVLFPKLFRQNNSISVGLIGGTMDKFNYGGMGVSTTIYGFHTDIMGWPTTHGKDADGVSQAHAQLSLHVGYQIPFHKYQSGGIRLVPLLGYAWFKEDYTVLDTKVTTTRGGFDYGGAFVFYQKDKNIGIYNFSIAYTRYTAWIGFGVEFPLRGYK